MRIGTTEAKAKLFELIRRVNSGEQVIITHRDAPVARLVPHEEEHEQLRS